MFHKYIRSWVDLKGIFKSSSTFLLYRKHILLNGLCCIVGNKPDPCDVCCNPDQARTHYTCVQGVVAWCILLLRYWLLQVGSFPLLGLLFFTFLLFPHRCRLMCTAEVYWSLQFMLNCPLVCTRGEGVKVEVEMKQQGRILIDMEACVVFMCLKQTSV